MPTLKQRLREYVSGCFTGIWVETQEPMEAVSGIQSLCQDEAWQFGRWDIDQGLRVAGQTVDDGQDPLSAVKSAGAMDDDTSILVLENFHRFLGAPEIIQAMASQLHAGKQSRSVIVVLAPVLELPPELEKMFVAIEHALPDREQLQEIAEGIGVEHGELPTGRELEQVLDAASGLTRAEAESAFSLSLVRHGRIAAETT